MKTAYWNALYITALALRAGLLTSPGYIHPDELFQSVEVMAAATFNIEANIPWEYADCSKPARSPVMPFLTAALPYMAYTRATGTAPSPELLILLPRCVMFILLLITAIAFLSTSWAYTVMGSRPFSNSCEMFWYGIMLMLFAESTKLQWFTEGKSTGRVLSTLLSAAVCTIIGIFTRFTFVLFVFPIACFMLYKLTQAVHNRDMPWRICCGIVLLTACAGVLSCALCLLFDDQFYGAIGILKRYPSPLNSLLYNMDHSNLALHGIHPRYQHTLINGFIMFGPGWLAAFVLCGMAVWTATNQKTHTVHAEHMQGTAHNWILLFAAIPLGLLSLAPHQEPRFLLPLAIPLALYIGSSKISNVNSAARIGIVCWLVFNFAAGYFFGYVHQAGVLPVATSAIMQRDSRNFHSYHMQPEAAKGYGGVPYEEVIFLGTYMVPHTLANIKPTSKAALSQATWCSNVTERTSEMDIYEFSDAHDQRFSSFLRKASQVTKCKGFLVAAPSTLWNSTISVISQHNLRVGHSQTLGRHVSTEHLPRLLDLITGHIVAGMIENKHCAA